MRHLKEISMGVALAALVVALFWGVKFGTAAPCDAARMQINETIKSDRERHAALDAIADASATFCVGIAIRLWTGDQSFIKFVKAR